MPDLAAYSYLLLVASLAALAVGPLLHSIARRHAALLAALDAFVLVTISWLVLLHVIPVAIAGGGWPAAAAALLGALGPGLAERWLRSAAHRVHAAALLLALAGIVVHTMLDGLALTAGRGAASQEAWLMLAIGVVVHRIPVGLTIWMLLRRPYGAFLAAGMLGMMMIGTVAGFALGDLISALATSTMLAVAQGFLGGMLLHVILHKPHEHEHEAAASDDHDEHAYERAATACDCHDEHEREEAACDCHLDDLDHLDQEHEHALEVAPQRRPWDIAAGIGALAGIGSVLLLSYLLPHVEAADAHAHAHGGFARTFWDLALESAPALLLGYTAAGLLAVLLPAASVAWLRGGSSISQTLRGMLFGLPLPVCSCGVIPLYRSLVLRGAPATAAMAFLVATPELGVDAVLLSIPLLGGRLAAARVIAAAIVALFVGWIVGGLVDRTGRGPGPTELAARPVQPLPRRLLAALQVGFGEIFSSTVLWILAGLIVAALANPMLQGGWLGTIPAAAQVPLFALLGLPAYICASGATPLVAVLIAQGVSPGAALAFLLTGPATNVTTFGVVSEMHGARVAVAFAATVAMISVGLGYAVNAALGSLGPAGHAAWQATAHEGHPASVLQQVALGLLGAALLAALLRKGPRGLVTEMSPRANPGTDGAGDCGCREDR